MILRPRQQEFVDKSVKALKAYGNTLGVAPTGSGKTIMLSAVIGELIKSNPNLKVCVLAHRDELTAQNTDKFTKINQDISVSVFNSRTKSWEGQVTFAMVQTLCKRHNLRQMPKLDLLVIDETHHITADSYLRVLDYARSLNSDLSVFGVTATPERGDKSNLGQVFSNCCDQIKIGELIASGHLVKPKTWIIDTGGTQEKLQALKIRKGGDYNDSEVSSILDHEPLNSEVVRHWHEKAGDRKTIVFCSDSSHAKNVLQAYLNAGVKAGIVTCKSSYNEKQSVLDDLKSNKLQVVINVAVLTEGWDFPPISCVVLLRSSSYKSTMIQMIGRGLRTLDPSIYPDIVKQDCIVLDFGISSILHGSLEQAIELSDYQGVKICPSCQQKIVKKVVICPLCGSDTKAEYVVSDAIHEGKERGVLENFGMRELDLVDASSFCWTKLNERAMVAQGLKSWGYVYNKDDIWVAVGGTDEASYVKGNIKKVYQGEKMQALAAANDFLYCFEAKESINKNVDWRREKPSQKQLECLSRYHIKADDLSKLSKGEVADVLAFHLKIKPRLIETPEIYRI